HSALSAPRRLRMHAHVAQVLRRNPSLSRGWEEVAHHAESGEVWDLAAQACAEAGRHCNRLRAYEAALDHVMRGLSHQDRLAGQWGLLQSLCEVASIAG